MTSGTDRTWLIPIALAIASMLLSGYVGYTAQRETIKIDMSVLTNQQKNDHERLERIEHKVDEVLRELRRP